MIFVLNSSIEIWQFKHNLLHTPEYKENMSKSHARAVKSGRLWAAPMRQVETHAANSVTLDLLVWEVKMLESRRACTLVLWLRPFSSSPLRGARQERTGARTESADRAHHRRSGNKASVFMRGAAFLKVRPSIWCGWKGNVDILRWLPVAVAHFCARLPLSLRTKTSGSFKAFRD